jgi:CRISPR/Cas system-associated endoribonuclease Cas2
MMIDIAEEEYKIDIRKTLSRTIDHFKHKEQQTIMFACNLFRVDRQVYYRRIKRKTNKEAKAIEVVSMINQVRKTMPRLGGKKSYHILMDDLKSMKIGRDKLFDILRANHLLIQPKRSYHVTTNSHHL